MAILKFFENIVISSFFILLPKRKNWIKMRFIWKKNKIRLCSLSSETSQCANFRVTPCIGARLHNNNNSIIIITIERANDRQDGVESLFFFSIPFSNAARTVVHMILLHYICTHVAYIIVHEVMCYNRRARVRETRTQTDDQTFRCARISCP